MQIQDLFKYIFQSSFGCEHMISSPEYARARIADEAVSCVKGNTLVDALDGNYSRVHFAYLNEGLSIETYSKIFVASAKKEESGKETLMTKLQVARELAKEGAFSFGCDELEEAIDKWEAEGFPAVHHSEVFREKYAPAYRVIDNKYVEFLPVFAGIDKTLAKGRTIVAIEGSSASGKTTLSKMLEEIYDCNVLHMDDFFLQPHQRTPERFAEPGGNVDRERFLEEVLIPLSKGDAIDYRRLDCSTMTIQEPMKIKPKKLTIIEGAYSMHPELADYYDLTIFLNVNPQVQAARIAIRNTSEFAERFHNEWIPMERRYFEAMDVKERADIVISIDE
jgi:uridine kinase